jgi:hypothetical protein
MYVINWSTFYYDFEHLYNILRFQKKDLISDTNLSEIERYISMTEGECEIDNINRDLKGVFGLPRLRVSYKSQ